MPWRQWIRTVEVEPSLYAADFSIIGEQIEVLLRAGCRVFHFDVGDGHFVEPITMGPIVLQSISPLIHRFEGAVDVHLMVEKPTKYFESIAAAGGDSATFHFEAVDDVPATIRRGARARPAGRGRVQPRDRARAGRRGGGRGRPRALHGDPPRLLGPAVPAARRTSGCAGCARRFPTTCSSRSTAASASTRFAGSTTKGSGCWSRAPRSSSSRTCRAPIAGSSKPSREPRARGPARARGARACAIRSRRWVPWSRPAGEIVGEGATEAAGRHAEVVALDAAGERARGATMFVTLEPCAHWGTTPPCADRIVEAGVARVVIGARDPNPEAAGGIERLRAAGRRGGADGLVRGAPAARGVPHLRRPGAPVRHLQGRDDARRPGRRCPASAGCRARRAGSSSTSCGRRSMRWPSAAARRGPTGPASTRVTSRPRRASRGGSSSRVGPLPGWSLDLELREPARCPTSCARSRPEGVQSLLLEGGPTLAAAFLAEGLVDKVLVFVAPTLAGDGPVAGRSATLGPRAVAPDGNAGRRRRSPRSVCPRALIPDRRERADDRLVTMLSHWLTRQLGNEELRRGVEEVGTDELAPGQREAVDELLEELRSAAARRARRPRDGRPRDARSARRRRLSAPALAPTWPCRSRRTARCQAPQLTCAASVNLRAIFRARSGSARTLGSARSVPGTVRKPWWDAAGRGL